MVAGGGKITSMSQADSFHLHAPDARSPLKREAWLITLSAREFEDAGNEMNIINWSKREILKRTKRVCVRPELGDCLEWQNRINQHGYGEIDITRDGMRQIHKAHRLMYLFSFGNPGELHVLHKCDNPPCVNPDHLFLGTRSDNMVDAIKKGRWSSCKFTPTEIIRVRERRKAGWSVQKLADHYGVIPSTISKITTGRSWRHVITPAAREEGT